MAVVADCEIIYAEGFGVRELGKDDPVTPDTLFGIGSMTKSINAMMVASLVNEGFLEWDTPAAEIWQDFQLADPEATSAVTVRDLLSMRTGMRRDDELWEGKNLSAEELILALAQVPVAGQPGEQHYYDNQGVATGAYLGAMAAGGEFGGLFDAYAGLMQERVFGPIGMTSSALDFESMEAHAEGARPHYTTLNGRLVETGFDVTPTHFWDVAAISPAGEVRASAMDVGRFLMTMLAEGVAPDGTRVVSPESLAETWTGQIEMQPDPWLSSFESAPGWNVADYQGISVGTKDGTIGCFVANIAFIPDADTGIVVLSNLDFPVPVSSVHWRLVELLYGLEPNVEELLKPGIDQFLAGLSEAYTQLLPVDLESVAPYLGGYESEGNPYTIEWRDGSLWYGQGSLDIAQLLGSPEGGYLSISPNDFYLPFQFVEGEDGSITLVIAGFIEATKLVSFEAGLCITTLAAQLPIEFEYLETIPTGFDGINQAACTFTKQTETVTLSGPAEHTEIVTLAEPTTEVSFPLPEGTLSRSPHWR